VARPVTPLDRKDINYSVKLSPVDMQFLDSFKEQLGYNAIADAVRDIVVAFRTTFSLPQYQAERLKRDMTERNMTFIQYLQELLARRYEELSKDTTPTRR